MSMREMMLTCVLAVTAGGCDTRSTQTSLATWCTVSFTAPLVLKDSTEPGGVTVGDIPSVGCMTAANPLSEASIIRGDSFELTAKGYDVFLIDKQSGMECEDRHARVDWRHGGIVWELLFSFNCNGVEVTGSSLYQP